MLNIGWPTAHTYKQFEAILVSYALFWGHQTREHFLRSLSASFYLQYFTLYPIGYSNK